MILPIHDVAVFAIAAVLLRILIKRLIKSAAIAVRMISTNTGIPV
jgi:hypothetical protein